MIFDFLWLSFWEFLQNAAAMAAVIILLPKWDSFGWKRRAWTSALGGTVLILIVHLTETPKIGVTSLPSSADWNIVSIIIMAIIFAAMLYGTVAYFRSKWSGALSDLIAGVALAILLAISEFCSLLMQDGSGPSSPARVLLHTAAYLITVPGIMLCTRKAAAARPVRRALWAALAAAAMSLLIAAVAYMPFLK